eukprot:2682662-Amphidinium_carterae.1
MKNFFGGWALRWHALYPFKAFRAVSGPAFAGNHEFWVHPSEVRRFPDSIAKFTALLQARLCQQRKIGDQRNTSKPWSKVYAAKPKP